MSLITCSDVSLSYDNHVVLTDLSFEINSGDYICIVGENGSGKTTLIKALLFLKQAQKGEIKLSEGLKQNEIGYLPQQTTSQKDFPASVWEVVLSGCLNRKSLYPFYSKSDKKRALFNMERLSIEELKNKSYRELSGGQQQRVLLARALCATQKMILLDEPAAGLDPIVTAEFYQLLKNLNKEGITVVIVSHDLSGAIKYASHILHLEKKQVFFGRTEEYVNSDAGRRFLGGVNIV